MSDNKINEIRERQEKRKAHPFILDYKQTLSDVDYLLWKIDTIYNELEQERINESKRRK